MAKKKLDTELQDVADEAVEMAADYEVEMFGESEARWYQIAAKHGVEQALLAWYKKGRKTRAPRILVVLPTGAGKTLTSGLIFSSDIVRKCLGVKKGDNMDLLFVAHKHRLLTQAERVYAAAEQVNFMEQSAFSQLPKRLDWHICCIDEAHHEAMSTIQHHLEKLGDKPIIGLTATPDRADGCVIKFDVIINPISREQAVAEGWLAPTNIHTIVDVPSKEKVEILKDVFNTYADQMGQTMVFVRTKKEVAALETVLKNLGKKVVGITSMTEKELDKVLDQFSEGKWQFIINCNKINEGVDVKSCTDVVLGRQYGSYSQLNQVIGRASRPDSDCNVWELVNPLSGRNLDTTVIVGTPESHRLLYKEGGAWKEREFKYVSHMTTKQMGVSFSENGGGQRVMMGR